MSDKNTKVMAHCGCRKVTVDQLRDLPTPPPLGPRHRPLPHADLWEALERAVTRNNYVIEAEDIAVGTTTNLGNDTYTDTSMFGVIDIRPSDVEDGEGAGGDEYGLTLGFRSNNTRKLPIHVVAGARVFVCDNLAMLGDAQVLKKRHTLNFSVFDEIDRAFKDYLATTERMHDGVRMLKAKALSDVEAKASLFDIFSAKLLPTNRKYMERVAQTYFAPEDDWTDTTPRSMWGSTMQSPGSYARSR